MRPTLTRLVILLLGVLASLASTLNPGEDMPEIDDCSDPITAGATTIEIGAGDEDSFRPLADDDIATIVIGGQGLDMLPLRFRVNGLPAGCVSHETRIEYCEPNSSCLESEREQIAFAATALQTHDDGASPTTRPFFVILDRGPAPGTPLFVSVRIAGVVARVQLWAEEAGTFADAGPDAF